VGQNTEGSMGESEEGALADTELRTHHGAEVNLGYSDGREGLAIASRCYGRTDPAGRNNLASEALQCLLSSQVICDVFTVDEQKPVLRVHPQRKPRGAGSSNP
jgi:hypothetical protein